MTHKSEEKDNLVNVKMKRTDISREKNAADQLIYKTDFNLVCDEVNARYGEKKKIDENYTI